MQLLRHSVEVYRKAKTGTGISAKYGDVPVQKYRCLAVPMSDRAAAANGYEVGKTYTVLTFADADIQTGDKLVTNIGITLFAAGTKFYQNMPPVSHLEVTALTEEN